MEGGDTYYKLFKSCFDGDLEGVADALAQGGSLSWRNQKCTPLLCAAIMRHTDLCGLLLVYGSNVNETMPGTNETALHFAVRNCHEALVEALLSWNANVNSQTHQGKTPLFEACQTGSLPCVLKLLKAGASVTLPNMYGSMPIHRAAESNNKEIVKILLEHGCSPDMASCIAYQSLSILLFSSFSPTSCMQGHHLWLQQAKEVTRQWRSSSPKELTLIC